MERSLTGLDPSGVLGGRPAGTPRRSPTHYARVGSPPMPALAPPAIILLVDDDPELAVALTPHLEACGWRVRYAADGEDALRQADLGFDLAVVDMMLPRLSGFQVVHFIRARFGPLRPVVMLSEFDAPEHRAYADLVGVTHFVAKPFALNHLLGVVAGLLPKL